MKILITGAAGFIGFHLARKLLSIGENVIGIDNINDYYEQSLKYDRLKECGIDRIAIESNNNLIQSDKFPNFSFVKIDITDRESIEKLFEKEKFDVVVNLAAQAGVRYSLENPHAYVDSNLVGFINLLECCRHNQIKHFVYASSSSIYGMNDKIPFAEEDRVDHPVSLYAATKKSNELMAHSYSHLYSLPTTGLRFFTVYGPWGRPDMAPMLFANAISQGKPIKVFNHGDMERDFTYIDDIVNGINEVIKNPPSKDDDRPFYRLFNIGNSKPIHLMEFIETIEKSLNIKAKLDMLPMQPGDVKRTWADTSNLEKLVMYKPNTSLEEGVEKFIKWYKKYYK
ncbi:NAD-dependent epimerase [Aureibacter tunicatorum]|uniref:UDP-glucuronate 4-epimerase n=1 Tax=Aureibacter tunicatorum TaxID=866807 RepID=A0AAE4BUH8_9BACT|nr:NAD-dependent epimerase [Aureibacter tunicatorum]MDR6240778.1 UDP-glucuronate 4-epimerase [Aureibacter tunicatorum]BDD06889.1 hypothetical protein AUTU_43720 [Aureibacter tunicatorum]